MLIDFGAKRLLLCDMYCLNPACNCQDSIIEIFDTESEIGLLSYGGFTVNYRQPCWEKYIPGEDSILDDIPMPVLRALAENQIPEFYRKLEERHKKLRQLYRLRRSQLFNSLDFINKLGLGLYDYKDNFPQFINRLFAEAEEREGVDNGAMLQQVVSLQDTLLAKGISNINDWLKAAERP